MKAFTRFRLPNSKEAIEISGSWRSISVENEVEQGFLVSTFTGEFYLLDEDTRLVEAYSEPNYIDEFDLKKINYLECVETLIDKMQESEFEKIVFSRIKTIPTEMSIDLAFENILKAHPDKFCYQTLMPDGAWWLGATPETLVSLNGTDLKTMALAGTQKKSSENNYHWETKEIEEHEFVADYIQEVLTPFSRDLIRGNRETVDAGPVVHLKTDFTAKVEFENLGKIIKQMHPTPAVCGIPKEKTKDQILKSENYNRSFYTGVIGYVNQESTNLFVNLRCMRNSKNGFQLFVGGGLTKDSIAEKEWEETELKSEALGKIIQ